VAEEKAAAQPGEESRGLGGGKPIILYALVLINMLVVGGVGLMLFLKSKQDQEQMKAIDAAANAIAEGEQGQGYGGAGAEEEFIGKTIPLETFVVNLSGNRGNKILKVVMELEVEGERIAEEIDKRKPQIRDIIIIILSSKTYAQVSTAEGKEHLRDEIRDTLNSFLSKGKVKRVLFTEFVFN